jgi:hypothetical protein
VSEVLDNPVPFEIKAACGSLNSNPATEQFFQTISGMPSKAASGQLGQANMTKDPGSGKKQAPAFHAAPRIKQPQQIVRKGKKIVKS